jgi:MoaA/NifB/PqqE/SkfB family radical SAM enzyme
MLGESYNVRTMTVISDFNADDIDNIIDFVKGIGAVPYFQIMSKTGRGESLDISFNASRIIEHLEKRNVNYKPLMGACDTNVCTHIGSRVGIDEKGNIIQCPYLKRFTFGTIYDFNEESFREDTKSIKHITCSFQEG